MQGHKNRMGSVLVILPVGTYGPLFYLLLLLCKAVMEKIQTIESRRRRRKKITKITIENEQVQE